MRVAEEDKNNYKNHEGITEIRITIGSTEEMYCDNRHSLTSANNTD